VTQSRDYRKGAVRRPANRKGAPGWLWAVVGLVIGLGIAGIYVKIKSRAPTEPPVSRQKKREPISESDIPEVDPGPAGPYTYDKTLKNSRVEIPEKTAEPHRDARPVPELRPGTYVLQIAAYKTEADADRQRAKLAMIGVEASIQMVTVNDQTYYRVRVGPFKSLDELNRIRERLRGAEIEATQTRIGD